MPIEQFSLEFSKYKAAFCRKGEKVVRVFDKERDVGVNVMQHEGGDDEDGERVDMEPGGDGVFCYKVHDDFTIVVRLGLEHETAAKLLHPVLVLDDGVEHAYPPFDLLAGGIFQLPQNLHMDMGEVPPFWLLKENGEVILKLMIHVDD